MHAVLAGLAILVLGSVPREEPGTLEVATLEGTWVEATSTWYFRDGALRIINKGSPQPILYKYQLGSKAGFATIDIGAFHGIWKIDGDTLKVAFSLKDQSLPTGFQSQPGTRIYSYSLRRTGS